jgi:hypothetical protein
MPELTRRLHVVSSAIDRAIGRVIGEVESFTLQIDELERAASEGPLTDADHELLESIKSRVDALDPTNPEILITATDE